MLSDLVLKAQVMALDLSEVPPAQQPAALNRLREQLGTENAVLMTSGGTVLASTSAAMDKLAPSVPENALRQARLNRGYGAVEPVGERGWSCA